jgi:hypothetical protein
VESDNDVFQKQQKKKPVARRLFASPSPVKEIKTPERSGIPRSTPEQLSRKLQEQRTPKSKGRGGTPINKRVVRKLFASPQKTPRGKSSTPTVAGVAQEAANEIKRSGTKVPNHLAVRSPQTPRGKGRTPTTKRVVRKLFDSPPTEGSPQTPQRQGIPRSTSEQWSRKLQEQRKEGAKMYRNVISKIKKIENSPPKAKRELFPNSKKIEKQVRLERKLELKNYMTKADFNKLVEKLDKPRTPAAQQLTKSNIAELLKPLINKKKDGPKYSLFGSFYPKNKKDGKPLFSRKPESVVRDIAKSASKKFRKEIVTKVKAPRTPVMPVMRTPTTGQRKKHVIELIDRVIKKMKVSRDTEKKIIDFYEALSEKYIKQMFGGKSKEEVRSIIKKQVDFFNKKKKR